METKSLDELLGDEPAEVIDAPVVEQPVEDSEAAAQRERDERGRFAAKGEDEGAPPAPEDNKAKGLEAATAAERRKRQEVEAELAAIRAELEAAKTPPPPAPDLWENPEGWQQHFGGQVVSQAVEQASRNATLNMSEMLARQKHDDFDDVKGEFLALAEANPQLVQQALSDPHPWAKAYQIAKNHKTMSELGATDLDSVKAKLREEIMAEMAASAIPNSGGIPPTLANERNVGNRSGPAWAGPKSLDELLR